MHKAKEKLKEYFAREGPDSHVLKNFDKVELIKCGNIFLWIINYRNQNYTGKTPWYINGMIMYKNTKGIGVIWDCQCVDRFKTIYSRRDAIRVAKRITMPALIKRFGDRIFQQPQ